jgi:hypothetical protein
VAKLIVPARLVRARFVTIMPAVAVYAPTGNLISAPARIEQRPDISYRSRWQE